MQLLIQLVTKFLFLYRFISLTAKLANACA